MKQKHMTPEDIKQAVLEQRSALKEEAVRKASDEVVSQIYACLALAIMEDREDIRTEEERGEYIQRIYDSTTRIWREAAATGKARSYRLITAKLKDKYGIVIAGL